MNKGQNENNEFDITSFLNIFNNENNESKERIVIKPTVTIKKNHTFDLSFKIGNYNGFYVILNLKDFIDAKRNNSIYKLRESFSYDPTKHYFSKSDEEIIKFIQSHVYPLYLNANEDFAISNKLIKINQKHLKSVLSLFIDKEIDFNYSIDDKSINGTFTILNDNLPVDFKLSLKGNEYLTLEMSDFLPIDYDTQVCCLDKKIYIINLTQHKYISQIKKMFRKSNVLNVLLSQKELFFENVLPVLKMISSNIIFDENIKTIIEDSELKINFFVDKENRNILIDKKFIYGDLEASKSENKYIVRDYETENKVNDLLFDLGFIKKENTKYTYIFSGDDEKLFYFLNEGVNVLKTFGDIFYSQSFREYQILKEPVINAKLKNSPDYLSFEFEIENINNFQINDILDSIKKNKKFYKLNENSFLDLSNRELFNFLSLIDNLDVLDNEHKESLENIEIPKNKAFYLQEYIEENNLKFIKGTRNIDNIVNKLKNISDTNFEIPKELNATLRNYQIEGYKWFRTLDYLGCSGILADSMGLGKTLQAITYILSKKKSKTLIVAPTSLVYNWKQELEKFAPTLKFEIIYGAKTVRENIINSLNNYDVLLTTYGTLCNDLEMYKNVEFDIMIIDEAQKIKNSTSQNALTTKLIKAKHKFALTGTPIENSPLELWSIFDYAMPGFLGSRNKFALKYLKSSSEEERENNFKTLKKTIEPFILRREKKKVLNELPDKTEKIIYIELSDIQKEIYLKYVTSLREKMLNDPENSKFKIFSYMTKLRQLCLAPSLVLDNYEGENSKLNKALELIENYIKEGHKILFFSQFTKVLNILISKLKAKGINYYYIDGNIKANDRIKAVNEFNSDTENGVFLISLKAGGTGLNLTSADVVIHFDPWWNPAVEEQATDRAHRMGQKNKVEVIKLISKGTIEEKIIQLQDDKKAIIDEIMSNNLNNASTISNLSESELIDLFK